MLSGDQMWLNSHGRI